MDRAGAARRHRQVKGGLSNQLIKVLRGHPHIADKTASLETLPGKTANKVSYVMRSAATSTANFEEVGELHHLKQLRWVPQDLFPALGAYDG